MKIEFNNKGKKNKDENRSELMKGSFEDLLKARKKKLPEIQESIQEILEDYDGGLVTIIVQKEDENAEPESTMMLVAGVAGFKSQLAHIKNMDTARKHVLETIMSSTKGDVEAMMQLASVMADDIKDKLGD